MYDIPLTKIQQGTINVTTGKKLTNVEFRFDGNDGSARLQWASAYAKNGEHLGWLPLQLDSGAITESDDVDNSNHGLESAYDRQVQFTGTPKVNPMLFSGRFYGGAGLLWNPSSADYAFICSNAVSATTGRVEVAKGTLKFVNGASFTALSGLIVGATGVLEIEQGSGANFRAETLDVLSGCKLKIGEGVVVTVGAATLDALPLGAGTYSQAAGDGIKAASWIEGSGTVVVETGSLSTATWIGEGENNGIATEDNWQQSAPDISSGETFATFAEGGSSANLGCDASFAGLSLKGGFAFTGEGTLQIGENGIAALDAASATEYNFACQIGISGSQTWAIGENNTFNVTGGMTGILHRRRKERGEFGRREYEVRCGEVPLVARGQKSQYHGLERRCLNEAA